MLNFNKRGNLFKKAESKPLLILFFSISFILIVLALSGKNNNLITGNVVLGPNNPGTVVDDASIGTAVWANGSLNNAKISDNSWAFCGTSSGGTCHYLKTTNFGFNVPGNSIVNGVVVEVKKKANLDTPASHIVDNSIKLVRNNNVVGSERVTDTTTYWSISGAYFSYGGSTDTWGLSDLTYSDVNSANFGVAFSSQNSGNVLANVDHIRITVYYTEPTIPNAPSNLVATSVSSSQIDLTWTDNSNNEDGFRIERATGATSPDIFSQIASVGANVAQYPSSGLSSNTRYWYRVYSYNVAGNSIYSNTADATTQQQPIPVVTLNSPQNSYTSPSTSVNFSCSSTISSGSLTSIALYGNWEGGWSLKDTQTISGVSGSGSFNETISLNGNYNWNCQSCASSLCSFAASNFTLTVQQQTPGAPTVTFVSPTPSNGATQENTSVYINTTVTDLVSNINNCTLIWNNVDTPMTLIGNGLSVNCFLEKTSLATGTHTYTVKATNSAGLTGNSESRTITIGDEDNTTLPPPDGQTCLESWSCGNWEECLDGMQTRTCTDSTNCGTFLYKPSTQSSCGDNLVSSFDLAMNIPDRNKFVIPDSDVYSILEITTSEENDFNVNVNYIIENSNGEAIIDVVDDLELKGSTRVNKWLKAPEEEGSYTLKVYLRSSGAEKQVQDTFEVVPLNSSVNGMSNILTAVLVLVFIAVIAAGMLGIRLSRKEPEKDKTKKETSNLKTNKK